MDIIIFGIGSYAELLTYYIKKYTDWNIKAYVVDAQYKKDDLFLNIPLLETQAALSNYSASDTGVVLAVGYNGMNQTRADKYVMFKQKGYLLPNLIHPSVVLEDCEIGDGNIFLEKVSVGPFSKIGNANAFWNGVTVSHNNVVGDFNWMAPASSTGGGVELKNNVFIGVGATIRSGKCIDSYSLIGAGCYISQDTQEKKVYVPVRSLCLEEKTCFDMHL